MEIIKAKTPKKPEQTKSTIDLLILHYHTQGAKVIELRGDGFYEYEYNIEEIKTFKTKSWLINEIRRQNRMLGRSIKRRAHELLIDKSRDTNGNFRSFDGRSVGLMYNEIIDILNTEFPEASTSVACLRWYVVHMRQEANEQGLPWPELPQIRPRARIKK